MLLANHFPWFGAGSQAVEREITGSRLSTGSEPAPTTCRCKRGMSCLVLRILSGPQSCLVHSDTDMAQLLHCSAISNMTALDIKALCVCMLQVPVCCGARDSKTTGQRQHCTASSGPGLICITHTITKLEYHTLSHTHSTHLSLDCSDLCQVTIWTI